VLGIFPAPIRAALSDQGGRLSMMTPSRTLLLPLIMRRWCSIMRSTGISSSGKTMVTTSVFVLARTLGLTRVRAVAPPQARDSRRARADGAIPSERVRAKIGSGC